VILSQKGVGAVFAELDTRSTLRGGAIVPVGWVRPQGALHQPGFDIFLVNRRLTPSVDTPVLVQRRRTSVGETTMYDQHL